MQFGHALDRILHEILLANPAFGLVQLIKVDISDGFYHVDLYKDDIPKLGLSFPTEMVKNPLLHFPWSCPWVEEQSPNFQHYY